MNMPLDAKRVQHETARYLPQPLYILYVQATAYKEACDSNLELKILGDLDVAKAAMETKTAARGLFFEQRITHCFTYIEHSLKFWMLASGPYWTIQYMVKFEQLVKADSLKVINL